MAETATPTTSTTAAQADKDAAATTKPIAEPKPAKFGYHWGTGRRKAAVARVRVRPGDGKFLVNKREVDDFFNEERDRKDVREPLEVTKTAGQIDVFVSVHGGGYMGQAGAVRLGVARALMGYDPTLEATLRDHDMLTRDPRKVERKKPGQPGARKRFQFSKR